MMPPCDQIGVPIHFHSSTTSGSASLMSSRILLRVSPRQSPRSAILFEMSSDAGWPWFAPDFFMFSSSHYPSSVEARGRASTTERLTDVAYRHYGSPRTRDSRSPAHEVRGFRL